MLLRHETGLLVAPPGSGKTVLGTYLVARRKTSTLILVHRQPLLDQWLAQLALFLGVDQKEIGQIGAGKRRSNGSLDVAMLQSLVRSGEVDELVGSYGHVIVDECHHVPAVSFENVLNAVKARYLVGLTATPLRRDGHHPIIQMQLGPVRFTVKPEDSTATRSRRYGLVVRETGFRLPPGHGEMKIQELYGALARDEGRNRMILDDVLLAVESGRSPIVLTERRDHLEWLAARLKNAVRHLVVMTGGGTPKRRREIADRLARIPDGEERLVLATGRYIGEGFDDARLDTLFLALPVSWKGTLVQYAGRLHRTHPTKTQVLVFDYLDRAVPMLLRMYERRLRTYRAIGYVPQECPLNDVRGQQEPKVEWLDGGKEGTDNALPKGDV
jgi:superfamily II DNA or RNA helicase